jgi:hypothetical protein
MLPVRQYRKLLKTQLDHHEPHSQPEPAPRSGTQNFYRYYVFPNAGHCGGAGMSTDLLFDALVNWVENGVAPDYLVAQVNSTRTRKVCMYPNTAVYIGSGSTDAQENFYCQINAQDDLDLLAEEAGLLQGEGPLKGNHDIGNLP